jgi:hypothetical protein
MPNTTDFQTIAISDLSWITGGASRVSSRGGNNEQLTQMLTQVTSSIKELGASKSSGGDSSMMMMMMMMMGGGGGGGGQQVAAAPPPAVPPPAQPNINVSVRA